jgi:hypothetical protein
LPLPDFTTIDRTGSAIVCVLTAVSSKAKFTAV